MRTLVTGSDGKLGQFVMAALGTYGLEAIPFDRTRGQDVLDLAQVREAAEGCDGIVHLAAIPYDDGPPENIIDLNVRGLWHALQTAVELGIPRFVNLSSSMATGLFQTGVPPERLPLDDDHPARPVTPYSLSKRAGEILCEGVTRGGTTSVISLRPAYIMSPDEQASFREYIDGLVEAADPMADYAAWVDGRDVAEAVVLALEAPAAVHGSMLIAAADVISTSPASVVADRCYPHVPAALPKELPFASLVRSDRARTALGWTPQFGRERP